MGKDMFTIPLPAQCLEQRFLEDPVVSEGHDHTQLFIADHFTVSPNIGGDHGQPADHCFEKDIGPTLIGRGKHEQVGR